MVGLEPPEKTAISSSPSIEAWLEQRDVDLVRPAKRKRSWIEEKASTGSELSIAPDQSLTRHSLRLLEKMQRTPERSRSDRNEAQATLVRTASSSSIAAASSISLASKPAKDATYIRDRLKEHGMIQEDVRALEAYPTFEAAMRCILNARRHSPMPITQQREFAKTHTKVYDENESTFVQTLLPLVVQRHYTAHTKSREDSGQRSPPDIPRTADENTSRERPIYTVQAWSDDGLHTVMGADFRKNCIPNFFHGLGFSDEEAQLLARNQGITSPRPDYCYGLDKDTFPLPQGISYSDSLFADLEICPSLRHAFFLIEGKSLRGILPDAQNQACRGGAALVNAARNVYTAAGYNDLYSAGPDERTAVFSATLTPDLMRFWLHWAEVRPDGIVKFHMNRLITKYFDDQEHIKELRIICHNILEWGCNTRKPELQALNDRLATMQRRDWEGNAAQSRKKRKA